MALLCALLGGCALQMDLPADFLRLDTGNDELKATSPDGATVWVREFTDRDEGTVSFWAEALENDLTENRGYVLQSSDAVTDGAGNEGRQLRLSANVDGERWGYLVAVFVLPGTFHNTIRVLEFTARQELFESYVDQVEASIATLRG